MASWDSFKAFGDKLDASFLKPHLDAEGQIDYNATASSFYQWIESLRQKPKDYGIPDDNSCDVVKLLDHFFPKPAKGENLHPRRISSNKGYPDSLRKIVPVKVSSGTGKSPILIVDAPNALGYIFSLAKPPAGSSPGFADYLLPLAVCYAWATYLAFLWPRSGDSRIITNVPSQLSLIYLPGGSSAAMTFCLGGAWSGEDPADAGGAGLREDDEDEMDRWRFKYMVEPIFSASSLALKPSWGPKIQRVAARRLNEYILGQKNFDPKKTPFLEPLFDGIFSKIPGLPQGIAGLSEYIDVISTLIMAELFQPLAVVVDPELLVANSKLGPILMSLMTPVLDAMWDEVNYPRLLVALQKLLQFYLTPHILDPVTNNELTPGPKTKPIVDVVVNSVPVLLPAMKVKLESLIHHLNNTHESDDPDTGFLELFYYIPNNRSYTRSSELFPLYALYRCQKGDSPPMSNLTGIRGINLNPRALGQAILNGLFGTKFSAGELDGATFRKIEDQETNDPVVGPPDSEAAILVQLPEAELKDKLDTYNQDATAACPRSMSLFEDAK